jgi:hypothetical protein
LALSAGYFVGWGHGRDVAVLESQPVERLVYRDWPYASVCAEMLEAAWSVGIAPPVALNLPHKP